MLYVCHAGHRARAPREKELASCFLLMAGPESRDWFLSLSRHPDPTGAEIAQTKKHRILQREAEDPTRQINALGQSRLVPDRSNVLD